MILSHGPVLQIKKNIYYIIIISLHDYARILEYKLKSKKLLTAGSLSANISINTPLKSALIKEIKRLLLNIKKKK